ncbi:uncharacterized protein BO96DRAFT_430666 [Aspergillus niger CBS 101883]|uniref:uncharacterized protein n=1 Tax=Aspergillus lacticoffeatus (strain CBS 101883) TaxID=1450533 RepID=UPI000D8019D6|nr:uncharacterized protein BO96DRAFT_430666 [Aspergillus niger CBS 101883]PYH60755.1 hypothetical protein BO96DRAFT_430666 [Aspergillus niger CBS 101883]
MPLEKYQNPRVGISTNPRVGALHVIWRKGILGFFLAHSKIQEDGMDHFRFPSRVAILSNLVNVESSISEESWYMTFQPWDGSIF